MKHRLFLNMCQMPQTLKAILCAALLCLGTAQPACARIQDVNPYNIRFLAGNGELSASAKIFFDNLTKLLRDMDAPMTLPEKKDFSNEAAWAEHVGQTCLLRARGKERWDIDSINRVQLAIQKEPERFFPLFQTLNMYLPVYPVQHSADAILIYGATLEIMQERLAFLATLLNSTSVKDIFFLTGQRTLREDEQQAAAELVKKLPLSEQKKPLYVNIKEEGKLAFLLVATSRLPESVKARIRIIYSGPAEGRDRATTASTLDSWLKTYRKPIKPFPKKIIAISTNPFIAQQHMALKNALSQHQSDDDTFEVETVGNTLAFKALLPFYMPQPTKLKSVEQKVTADAGRAVLVLCDAVACALHEEFTHTPKTQADDKN